MTGLGTSLPLWAALLEMAQGDPLRAQQMEAELSQEWWSYYQTWCEERNAAKAK